MTSRIRHVPALGSSIARIALCLLIVASAAIATAATAGAVTAFGQPKGNPYVVKLDAQGKPVPFTIVGTGFKPGTYVFVEQCDAHPPSAPNWLPTRDCDIGTAIAPVFADASGTARFPAGDVNHGFVPFVGLGPEGLFNCLASGAKNPKNGLPVYQTCQLRLSSNNNFATNDQVFMPIAFGHVPGAATTSHSSGSSHTWVWIVVAVALVLAVGGGAFAFRSIRAR